MQSNLYQFSNNFPNLLNSPTLFHVCLFSAKALVYLSNKANERTMTLMKHVFLVLKLENEIDN